MNQTQQRVICRELEAISREIWTWPMLGGLARRCDILAAILKKIAIESTPAAVAKLTDERAEFEATYRSKFGESAQRNKVKGDAAWFGWESRALVMQGGIDRTIEPVDETQDWASLDGATAFDLIAERADGTIETRMQMETWAKARYGSEAKS